MKTRWLSPVTRFFVLGHLILSSCTLTPKGSNKQNPASSPQMVRLGAGTCLAAAALYQIYHHRTFTPPQKPASLKRLELAQELREIDGLGDSPCLKDHFQLMKEILTNTKAPSLEAQTQLLPSLKILCADYLELTQQKNTYSISEKQALTGCQDAIHALATRKPFDIKLTKNPDEIGYHVTTEKNLASILKVGLLPQRGGYGGLCQNLNRLGETIRGMTGDDYAERSEGFVHWTKDRKIAEKFMDDYRRCGQKPVLLALRTQVLHEFSQPDPCMPPQKAYRTERWIFPVDIQDITPREY
jgi:hypothetical protein